jgi:DNA-binding NarL/FixJ family response regulator
LFDTAVAAERCSKSSELAQVLSESRKMEQRYDAVLGAIRDGFTITEVAQKFGVSRQSVHAKLKH